MHDIISLSDASYNKNLFYKRGWDIQIIKSMFKITIKSVSSVYTKFLQYVDRRFFLFTVGMKKQCDDSMRMIVSVWKNSIFLWLLLWFSVLSLKTFVFDMNIDLILWNITEDINEGKSVQYSNPMYCRANQE